MKKKIWIVVAILIIAIVAVCGVFVYKNNYKKDMVKKFVETNIHYKVGDNYKLTMDRNGALYIQYHKDGKAKLKYSFNDTYSYATQDKTYVIMEKDKKYLEIANYKDDEISGKTNLVPSLGNTDRSNDYLGYYTNTVKNVYKDGEDKICLEFDEGKIWVDSKTFMVVAYEDSNQKVTLKYEQNVVTDEDVKMPNLEGYEKAN